MPEVRSPLTAEARLAQVRRGEAARRRRRLLREQAGPLWERMARVVPAVFTLQGKLDVRRLVAPAEAVVEALRGRAILALDTAARISLGRGLLAGGDVHAYVESRTVIDSLAEAGLVDASPWPDPVLVRPWAGPPRLLAVVPAVPPPYRALASGHLVVTRERLERELLGAVGPRPDLFALVEGG
ncbi:hypothetical protein L6R50_06230 [Myxococcota bacterium]|nr:hypothetical protein [Myxococcota bacterium]